MRKLPPSDVSTCAVLHASTDHAHKRWRSDVPIILPAWPIPTVHPLPGPPGRLWVAHHSTPPPQTMSPTTLYMRRRSLVNYEEFVAKEQMEQDKLDLVNCLCIKKESFYCESVIDTKFRIYRKKANSLSDAREFHDPETASSSGAPHAPNRPLTLPSSRGMPIRESGLPHNTRDIMGTSGNVFESLLAPEGPPLSSL